MCIILLMHYNSMAVYMSKYSMIQFQINPSSGVPIYKQIMNQITRHIASGHLQPGDELPSIRQIAAEYEINQMTVSKAYSLLEATNVLERNRGKRMAVASGQKSAETKEHRLGLLKPALEEVKKQSAQLSLEFEDVSEELRRLMEANNE